MVQVARQLLSAVTKVLLLADRVVVKQLLVAKTKVSSKLECSYVLCVCIFHISSGEQSLCIICSVSGSQ
jgi:hypothetical protein